MRPKVIASASYPEPPYVEWAGDAVFAGGVWWPGPATYTPGSAPYEALTTGAEDSYVRLENASSETGIWYNEFVLRFQTTPPSGSVVELHWGFAVPGSTPTFGAQTVAAYFDFDEFQQGGDFRQLGENAWSSRVPLLNTAGSTDLTVRAGAPEIPVHLWSVELFPAFTAMGLWPLRQRQNQAGSSSWPLRQRHNGASTGSWPLRQRQAAV